MDAGPVGITFEAELGADTRFDGVGALYVAELLKEAVLVLEENDPAVDGGGDAACWVANEVVDEAD
jgi:hypothetical protein